MPINKESRNKLNQIKQDRKRIINYLNELDVMLKSGKLTIQEHILKESRFLRGKSEKGWADYYKDCEIKIMNNEPCSIISPREPASYTPFLIILVAAIGIILAAQYTGLVIFSQEQTVSKDVNLVFANNTGYNISLDNAPLSLKISGSFTGNDFKLYLIDRDIKLLIADKTSKTGNLITGFAILNETNITSTTALQNITTTILNITTSTILENLTTTTDLTTTQETTSSILQQLTFSNTCIETCNLVNISSQPRLLAIIDNGSLTINKITYTFIKEIQQANITGKITVNLSTLQLPAEINKPVAWTKEVYIKNNENSNISESITIDIPDSASNIKIDNQDIAAIQSINITYKLTTSLEANSSIIHNITFETPAPTIQEETIQKGKLVTISADEHLSNILAYVNVEEQPRVTWHVLWRKDGKKISIQDVTSLDTDSNGLTDRIEWTVPSLSEQVFEVLAESTVGNYVVDPNKVNVTLTIFGANASDQIGTGVATLDINNDSASDLMILTTNSASGILPGETTSAGEVYIIYGRNYTDKKIINLDILQANITIRGANETGGLNWVRTGGDINNDKLPDILIGSTTADPPGGTSAGEVYIIYGSKNYGTNKLINLDIVSANITIRGDNANDGLGSDLASGDINNDNIYDIIAGAQNVDSGEISTSNEGAIYVVYGSANYGTGKRIDFNTVGSKANITIRGANTSDNLGSRASGGGTRIAIGDINNNGIVDIIAGTPNADPGGRSNAGEVYVIYGSANYGNGKTIDLDLVTANITIKGANASDNLGSSLLSSDINNDGIKDIIFGAQSADPPGGSNAGEVYVIYGSANYGNGKTIDLDLVTANITIRGDNVADQIASSLASGDINKDGLNDIIIGTNTPYVIYGSANYGTGKRIDLNTVSANITFKSNIQVLTQVEAANVNNISGYEAIFGISGKDGLAGTQTGAVYVYHGNEAAPILRGNNTVNDTTPFVNAKLKCISGFYSDGNYDNLHKSYWKWYHRNSANVNTEVLGNKTQEFNLTWIGEDTNDLIKCSQKVSDGYLNSSWYNSTPATVSTQSVVNVPQARQGGKTTSFERRTVDLITPEPITLEITDSINVPIILKNNLNIPLRGVTLGAKTNTPDLSFSFTEPEIPVLQPGQILTVNMIVESHSTPGTYTIDININITKPRYTDTVKLFVDLIEKGAFNKTIIVTRVAFAKDLFKENPECLELDELLVRAELELAGNRIEQARQLTEEAVRGCKDLVTSQTSIKEQKPISKVNLIFILALIGGVLSVLITYFIIKKKS